MSDLNVVCLIGRLAAVLPENLETPKAEREGE
jgi:hypothetical protein